MQTHKKPNLFILPGWGETVKRRPYQTLIKACKDRYNIVPLEYISERGQLLSENIKRIEKQLGKYPDSDSVLFGFSIGAVIAYQFATRMNFKKVLLCSMTALFEDDLSLYPVRAVNALFSKEEEKELRQMKYRKLRSPAFFFYGAKERIEMKKRTRELTRRFNSKLFVIPKTDHQLSVEYLKSIERVLLGK